MEDEAKTKWTLINMTMVIILVVFMIGVAVGRWEKKMETRSEMIKCKPGEYVYLESVNAGCDAFGHIHVYDDSYKRIK